MIDHPLPDIDAWVLFFSQAELPVLRHTVKTLNGLREDAENVNGRVLSSVILQDPLMTLRVLAYLAEHRHKNQLTDVATIERALMMIGVGPFFRDFENLPLVEDQLKSHPQALLGLLKVITRARQAAHWARELAVLRHDLDADEITIAALLHDTAEILMWCFAPSLALKVADMQTQNRSLRSTIAQQEVYGITLHEIQMALGYTFGLPQLLATLMDHTNAESPRIRNVALAVNLARHSANGWSDPALPDDFRNIEELLHISHDVLMAKLGLDVNDI
jgi:HD-like signal output (HDOD) protein